MQIKKIILVLLGCTFLIWSSTSCSDFLEEKPRSEFDGEAFFTDAETLNAGLVGAFSTMQSIYGVGSNTPLFITMIGTDEALYRGTNNIRASIDRYTFTSTDGCVQEFWTRYYKLITSVNTVISKGYEITNISESQRSYYIANGRFLRAWAYFNLVQIYGEVPLLVEHVKEYDYSVGRAPIKDVYAQIIEDLEYCIEEDRLPKTIKDGYANHWAAKTLLGKVYLTMASAKKANRVAGYQYIEESSESLYAKAFTVLKDIKENSGRDLEAVYGNVFKIENKNKTIETIWEIQFSKEIPYGSQWSKEYGAWPNGYDGTNLLGGWRSNAYAGNCNINYVPSLRNYYDADGYDVRRFWNLADSIVEFVKATNKPNQLKHISQTSNKPPLGDNNNRYTVNFSGITKYRWGKSWRDEHLDFTYSNCPNNVMALRFADVLLMLAEADLGDDGIISQDGLDAMNRIVQRARGLDERGVPVPASDTPGFNDYSTYTLYDVLKERARELCFERWRWFDLARTGTFEVFLAERQASTVTVTGFNPDRHYLFPIPLPEIQLSTNKEGMYQNPNY